MEKEFTVKSLAKAIHVLECFSLQEPELGVTEISRKLGMLKTTVFNILNTFEQLGYIVQNPKTGKYYLGTKVLSLSYIVNNHMGLRERFLPYLEQIAAACGEVCYFGVPEGHEVLYIESIYPPGQARLRNLLGERAPMHCTGLGKAMLAYMPQTDIPLPSFTPQTICDPNILQKALADIRERGYAIDNMEHEVGIKCVAVPVFGTDGRVIAAVSVSGPSMRFDDRTIEAHAKTMIDILRPLQNCL